MIVIIITKTKTTKTKTNITNTNITNTNTNINIMKKERADYLNYLRCSIISHPMRSIYQWSVKQLLDPTVITPLFALIDGVTTSKKYFLKFLPVVTPSTSVFQKLIKIILLKIDNNVKITIRRCQYKNIDSCKMLKEQVRHLTIVGDIDYCAVCEGDGCNGSSNEKAFGILILQLLFLFILSPSLLIH